MFCQISEKDFRLEVQTGGGEGGQEKGKEKGEGEDGGDASLSLSLSIDDLRKSFKEHSVRSLGCLRCFCSSCL